MIEILLKYFLYLKKLKIDYYFYDYLIYLNCYIEFNLISILMLFINLILI